MLLAPLHPQAGSREFAASNYTALLAVAMQFADLVVVGLAGAGAHWLRFGAPLGLDDVRHITIGVLFAALVFGGSPLYGNWRNTGAATEALRVVRMWSIAFAATVVFAVALKFANEVSRIWWAAWYVATLVGLFAVRFASHLALLWVRRKGLDVRSAVVVGGTPLAARIIDTFRSEQWAGICVQGWFANLDSDVEGTPVPSERSPYLGDLEALPGYVEAHGVQEVWLALPLRQQDRIDAILGSLRHSTADVKLVPDLFGLSLLNQSVGEIAGLPVISLQQTPFHGTNRLIKAFEDRLLSAAILLFIAPLMIAIAVAVKLSSPGPVFYRQERVSWNNRSFQILKFRTMPLDSESATGAVWAKPTDSRATAVGAFLRRTSLDELPQFINVLRGEMSIVGPRPERPVFVDKFKQEIPAYMKKHMVKAGITGWAQVNGWRGCTDLRRRIECDLFYVQNWSLAFDLRIMFMTLVRGFLNKHAY